MNRDRIQDIYKLTPAQRGMLVYSLMAPQTGAYFDQFRFAMKVDEGAFQQALELVVARHDALRTSFLWEDLDEAVQIVHKQVDVPFAVRDLRQLSPEQQSEAVHEFMIEDRRRGLELTRVPLLRMTLLRLSEEQYQVLWSYHHIVLDGWSIGLVQQELFGAYSAILAGKTPRLPPAPRFRTYVRWMAKQDQTTIESHWRQVLAGFEQRTLLGIDRGEHRPPGDLDSFVSREIEIAGSSLQRLRRFAKSQKVTPFTVLQGAWALTLGRYSDRRDVAFGVTLSGRPPGVKGINGMVGCFVNTLPVRVSFKPQDEIGPWLRQLQAALLELQRYQHSSLAQVQKWSDLPGDQPLFESILVSENFTQQVEDMEAFQRTNYPLVLYCLEREDSLRLALNYDLERYRADDIARLHEHIEALIDAIVSHGDASIQQALRQLQTQSRRAMVGPWNDTSVSNDFAQLPASRATLQGLFENRVDKAPQALAVVSSERTLSYGELEREANQLAHFLIGRGIGRGEFVAVHQRRGGDMIVAVLAILKAGGAYVPIDASLPVARVQYLIEAMDAQVVITQSALHDHFLTMPADGPLQHVLLLDPVSSEPAALAAAPAAPAAPAELPNHLTAWSRADVSACSDQRPEPRNDLDDIAYTIFTSGSTGTPKGVVMRHAPVLNLIEWVNRTYAVGPDDQILQVASLSFDLSVYDIFGGLACGASLRIANEDDLRSPERLLEILLSEPITFWDSAPAALQQVAPLFAAQRERAAASPLRLVFLSGDWIPLPLPDEIRDTFTNAQVVALGGATEAAIWSNFFAVEQVDAEWRSIPYGRPIQNARYYVLDDGLEPAPVGVAGDLFIGGDCLTMAYHGDTSLTAWKLVPDAHSTRQGDRLYRTGDRARFWADGVIEFLGRLDQQVKVRGFRIELGEIEAQLSKLEAVRDVVVMVRNDTVREDSPGDRRLAAYLVPHSPDVTYDVGDLREALLLELPEYMVPAAFLWLDALPVTANGKLDRKALPAPEGSRDGLGQAFEAPRNETERLLTEVLSEVLRVDQVGIHDNFFHLGGDSILSIQLVTRARKLGLEISPQQIFHHPTVAELALQAGVAQVIEELPLPDGPLPLTPIQAWFFEQNLVDSHHWNQAVMLEATEPLDASRLRQAVTAVVHHHDALRLRFQPSGVSGGESWTAQYAELQAGDGDDDGEALFHHIVLDSASQPGAVRPALTEQANELQASLDYRNGPMACFAFFEQADAHADSGDELGHGRLLIAIHHLAVDGVSWRILLEDLQVAYGQLAAGAEAVLPAKTSSFGHWALWLGEQAAQASDELPWWTAEERRSARSLPVDSAPASATSTSPNNTVATSQVVSFSLDSERTEALLQQVPAVYRSRIDDVLLTALTSSLASWLGGGRVLIDLEAHGREVAGDALDLNRSVGWFTSLYPLALDLDSANGGWGEQLKRIKEQLRQQPGIAQGAGYGLLRYLGTDEQRGALEAMPRAEMSFNYLGRLDNAGGDQMLLQPVAEATGMTAPRSQRPYLLDVLAMITGGRLEVQLVYSDQVHQRQTIETLATGFHHALEDLMAHCLSDGAGGFTPSDFPLAGLEQQALDQFLGDRRDIEDLYPLSPMQQGMAFHTRITGESMYTCQLSFNLPVDSNPDPSLLHQAWQAVLARHPMLRTSFAWQDLDGMLQQVHANAEAEWQELDWRHLAEAEQGRRLQRFLLEDRLRGFDLQQAPLLRWAWIDRGEHGCHFVWSFHHLVIDGWSMRSLLGEVFTLYEALRSGSGTSDAAPLPPVFPFRPYIEWLQQRDDKATEEFWRHELAGLQRPTPLGIDMPGAEGADEIAHASDRFFFTARLSQQVEELTKKLGITLNTLAQAAWAILLSRYSGEPDVMFGSTWSGRPADLLGAESIIGMFINTLPVRVRIEPEAQLGPWLQELQQRQANLREHGHTPVTTIQAWSEIPHGVGMYDSILLVENFPLELVGGGQANVREIHYEITNNFPLQITVTPGERLSLRMTYHPRLLDRAAIEQVVYQLSALLGELAEDPQRRVGAYTVPAPEAREILPDPSLPLPCSDYELVTESIHRWAEQTPGACAIRQQTREWTYAELDSAADRLAATLLAAGLERGDRVALAAGRSFGLLASLVAVLRAGGVIVPLDPALPIERRRLMVQRAAVSWALRAASTAAPTTTATATDAATDAALADVPSERQFVIDADEAQVVGPPPLAASSNTGSSKAANLAPPAPDDAAYVFFTSGTTGMPKAVLGCHRGLGHFFAWQRQMLDAKPADRCAQLTGLSFDVVLRDIFLPLTSGATLCLPPRVDLLPSTVLRWLEDEQISLVHTVPSVLASWLAAVPEGVELSSLRAVMSAGEPLDRELVQRFRRRFSAAKAEVINLYGPTETTLAKASYHVPANPRPGVQPLGQPLPESQLLIVVEDQGYRLAIAGEPGEIAVRTPFRTLGFLDDQGQLAAPRAASGQDKSGRFIANPFRTSGLGDEDDLIYLTGDRGRYLASGDVQYLGRLDDQVKIRGVRIDPGEVASVLRGHPEVHECTALGMTVDGAMQLVAYLATQAEPSEIRRFLRQRLPQAMLPTYLVVLDSLPLTANGKVDRRALPEPKEAVWQQAAAQAEAKAKAEAEAEQQRKAQAQPTQAPASLAMETQVAELVQSLMASGASATDVAAQVAALVAIQGTPTATETPNEPEGNDLQAMERQLGAIFAELLDVEDIGPESDFFALGGHSLMAMQLMARVQSDFGVELPLDTLFDASTVHQLASQILDLGGAPALSDPLAVIEDQLGALFGELLDVSEIGPKSDFFALGGHSLLAMQLMTRIQSDFGVELPLDTLFDASTVHELAGQILELTDGANLPAATAALASSTADPDAAAAITATPKSESLTIQPDSADIAAKSTKSQELQSHVLPQLVANLDQRYDPFPLNDLQEAYWIGQSAGFELGALAHSYRELSLPGLDLDRFEAAWQRLIERHDMLRAVVTEDGRLRILETLPQPFRIEVADLRQIDPDQAEQRVLEVRQRMCNQGPHTDTWPLFDLFAHRLPDNSVRFHISVSLIMSDGWSTLILIEELVRLYLQPELPLEPLQISPRDYAVALREMTSSDAYHKAHDYWWQRLDSLPAAPELPMAKDPAALVQPTFVRRHGTLDAELWQKLRSRVGEAGLTPTLALCAAYAQTLAAWSKEANFLLNLLFFNRQPVHRQIGQLVGNFSTTLLLEVAPPAGASYLQAARQLQRRLWRDMDHSLVTGVQVLRELNRRHGSSTRAAAPVVFTSTLDLGGDRQQRPDLPLTHGHLQTPQVWIDHQVWESGEGLRWHWDLVDDLFPEGMIDAMFEAYGDFVRQLAEGSEQAWQGQPDWLPEVQRSQRLAINATAQELPDEMLHTLFHRQATQQPERPAVFAAGVEISYGELAARANRVAHGVRGAGAEVNTLVAVVMEKGWQQVVATLGILNSGAAYLPIDPALPRDRQHHILERGQVRIALTQQHLADELTWPADLQVLAVDGGQKGDLKASQKSSLGYGDFSANSEQPLSVVQSPEDLAYVIFTSGSTGQPKGVTIDHRGAVNTILDINRSFDIGCDDRVFALSSLSFDLSVWDVFGLLAAGGAVVLPAASERRDPEAWQHSLRQHQVTVWNSVPALMDMLTQWAEGEGHSLPAALRLVMMSGDWIPVRLPDRIRDLSDGNPRLISLGGATEASIWSILYPIDEIDPAAPSVPYGKPMANQSFHVLDSDLRPRPTWVPGELYIGGRGLAKGYWRDGAKTGAAFLPSDPAHGTPRLYRTGDWGRYLPDGNIEFLGRQDLQVKVQGYRIELGEIETHLAQHPSLHAAVVTAPWHDGQRRLVAYGVPAKEDTGAIDDTGATDDAGQSLDAELLRQHLAETLPEYMVPSIFVELEELPLSANGKVDRQALPEPEQAAARRASFVPPEGEWQERLALLWEDVLETSPVGATDDFFELGGHSLAAVRLLTRIRDGFGQRLPLAALLEGATVERLAAMLQRSSDDAATTRSLVAIQTAGSDQRPNLFCVHPVGGNVLCYADLARRLSDDVSFYGLQSPPLDPDRATPTLSDLAAGYVSEIRETQSDGPYLLAGWSMGGIIAFEMARQLAADGQQTALVAMIDVAAPRVYGSAAEMDDARLLARFGHDLGGLVGQSLGLDAASLRSFEGRRLEERQLDDGQQLDRVFTAARDAGALPAELEISELAAWLGMFKRNFRALADYQPGFYDGNVLLLTAEESGNAADFRDAARGWSHHAAQASVVELPGDHYSLVRPPHVDELAAQLRSALKEAGVHQVPEI